MEFRQAKKNKPLLGISSFIIVLGFPLLSMLYNQTELGFLEVFEWGTIFGWFCIGTGLAIASLLKEKSQGFYILLPIITLALSVILMTFQLDV
ncbi:hypothetical protein KO495_03960 [Colwellia sp. D2M02]|uniref:hypothetical protein n=1 Tax=Colwellia sp. D2M02 TaxID=2841562 RepID=UPI001C0A3454|nr:hypothetical protein [Colwellia sp. D2M02]MBU2892476.1 hypothetical protein [Colwellia sp. D2M02]